ncbi:hypothetical protein [Kitasatospora fiedleri]|uniref:hypothetical protein n=1 Tax=Kitasatospora fiedleri TaxID=2991545 RepID=UPI00249B3856|nr:hypothetical protein [Kitasatospora fiedleri]
MTDHSTLVSGGGREVPKPALTERIDAILRIPSQRQAVETLLTCLESNDGQHQPRECPCLCRRERAARSDRLRHRVVSAGQGLLVTAGALFGVDGVTTVLDHGNSLQYFACGTFLLGAASALQLFHPGGKK